MAKKYPTKMDDEELGRFYGGFFKSKARGNNFSGGKGLAGKASGFLKSNPRGNDFGSSAKAGTSSKPKDVRGTVRGQSSVGYTGAKGSDAAKPAKSAMMSSSAPKPKAKAPSVSKGTAKPQYAYDPKAEKNAAAYKKSREELGRFYLQANSPEIFKRSRKTK